MRGGETLFCELMFEIEAGRIYEGAYGTDWGSSAKIRTTRDRQHGPCMRPAAAIRLRDPLLRLETIISVKGERLWWTVTKLV